MTEDLLADVFIQYVPESGSDNDDEAMRIDVTHLPEILADLGIYDHYYGLVDSPAAKRRQQRRLVEIIKALDPFDEGRVEFATFCEVMPVLMEQAAEEGGDGEAGAPREPPRKRARTSNAGVVQDMLLFTQGQRRPITLDDLKRVARDVCGDERVTDEELQDMLRLHAPGAPATAGLEISEEDFANILEQANL